MKKSVIIFTVLLSILSFSSCGTRSGKLAEVVVNTPEIEASDAEPSAFSATSEPETVQLITPAITSKIVNNCGNCAIQGEKIYYANSYDNGTLYSMNSNGSDNCKLNNDWTPWFYVSGDRIYYQNGKDGMKIYVMNTDGSGGQKLNDDDSGNINVTGDRIYYSNTDDGFTLYSMNTDGSDRKKLNGDIPLYMNVVGDRIYYSGELSGTKGIYSVKTDGTDRIKLTDDSPYLMIVADGWIYYNNENDGSKLYAIRTDGSDRHKLNDDYALRINVVDDLIYYVNGNEWKIYSINTDGGDRKLLSDDSADWLVVGDSRIYYTITGAKIYSMNIDGSDKQLLADLTSDEYKDVTYEISTRLREDMPEYRFVATGVTLGADEWATGYVMGLEVYDENDLPLLTADFSQTFYDQLIGNPVYNQMMDTMGLHVTDVNFDGYKDVIILNNFGGAHSNTWYDCWLWNPETSSFVESESFADICNPALDPEKKCIYSTGGSGAGNHEWDIYQFIDGEFVVTNSLFYEVTNEGYHFIEQRLVNGEMEIVRDDVIKEEDNFDDALTAAGYINDDLWQLDNPRWYGGGGHQADQWLE
ncbi:MAG TPA: DUF5050 domain-containing protein [Mobilitalea sp.]|nr:DUF5050 domain-containing protein [Mobilitalea sp.]